MIGDITLGQYFPGDSFIHNIDPRVKLVISMLLIVSIFVTSSLIGFAILTVTVFAIIFISKISVSVIFKGLKPLIYVLVFTTLIQIFLSRQGELLFAFGFIKIHLGGIFDAIRMILRIVLLITSTSVLLSYTTSPRVLTDGIEGILSPLAKIGVSKVHDFAMMMSIALRFIPTLTEETEKIMAAQKARGTDFSNGSLLKRAKALLPIFIPLLFSSIRRADELAVAMLCRCYKNGENRTRLHELKMKVSDVFLLIFSVLFTVGMVVLSKFSPDFLPI